MREEGLGGAGEEVEDGGAVQVPDAVGEWGEGR